MLSGLFKREPEQRSATSSIWGVWPGDDSKSPPVVTTSSAMQLLTVAGCVRLIADSISTLPLCVYREDNQGVKNEIKLPVWLEEPTVDLDFTSWCNQVLTSLLTAGNAFIHVLRAGNRIVELVPLDPNMIQVVRNKGRKQFFMQGREFPGEILHIPGLMLPGTDVGLSPLDYARAAIGGGLAAQEFAKDQFENFLNMPGVISYPNRVDPEQLQNTAKAWKKFRSRSGRGLPGVLEGGATYQSIGITNEAAQFLQARQWTAAEIAAQVYMVDPSDLGIPVAGTSLTYANLEQRNIRRLQVTFLPWIVRVEHAITSLLPRPQEAKFDVDGLLRADSKTRWEIYKIAADINTASAAQGMYPVLLTSEMRDKEDLNAIEEYPGAVLPVPADSTPTNPQLNAAQPLSVAVHLPESRQEPPNVFITNDVHVPEQRTPDVHVEPAAVVVDVQPVNVSVPGAEVRVTVPEEQPKTTVRRVERDAEGRIARIIDEVA